MVKQLLKNKITMKNIAYLSLIIGTIILVLYLIILFNNGYINFSNELSLDNISKIVPFFESIVGIFFTLGSTFLLLETLKITEIHNHNNQLIQYKNQFESVFFSLLTQQRQLKEDIKSKVEFEEDEVDTEETNGSSFMDDFCTLLSIEYQKTEKGKIQLLNVYDKYFTLHNSDLGHYFRHLYHIVKFVDNNSFFISIKDKEDFLKQSDYIGILRAQLTNSEMVLLAINGLTIQGQNFYKLIEKYELLKNINYEEKLPSDRHSRVPDRDLIKNEYSHLNK